jgi:fumarate hydratase class II
MTTRLEKDTLGTVPVPSGMLYGAQTARAVDNFPISGQPVGREMIRALGLIKKAAAEVNLELGELDARIAGAIVEAANQIIKGELDHHFPVDVFQTGSGTSSNMNVNEVIANVAIEALGGEVGSKFPVHPNDHVNRGQSSNDVFPSAIHIAVLGKTESALLPSLKALQASLKSKSEAYSDIVKTGRTHLQDAVLMTLGQEFSGYASQVAHGVRHIEETSVHLRELPIGGTAVGNGVNTHPEFGRQMADRLSALTGVALVEAENHFEAQAARDGAVRMSGALRCMALSLMKIANDLRWLGSGPRLGLGELRIPAVQPGSSIMPGKVNPVIAEALLQVCCQVVGNDAAIAAAAGLGNFELNAAQPLIARNLIESVKLVANGVTVFNEKMIGGLEPDRARIEAGVEQSLALATALVPSIGYDRAAEVARVAEAEGKTVRQVAREKELIPAEELDRLLDHKRLASKGQF